MTLPRARTWTVNSIPEWWTRCDRCKRWRLHARYHEFHGELSKNGISGTWWRECMECSFATVAALKEG
jgi:hypothetical protein